MICFTYKCRNISVKNLSAGARVDVVSAGIGYVQSSRDVELEVTGRTNMQVKIC